MRMCLLLVCAVRYFFFHLREICIKKMLRWTWCIWSEIISISTSDICFSLATEQMTAQSCSCAERHLECIATWAHCKAPKEEAFCLPRQGVGALHLVGMNKSSVRYIEVSATAIGFPWRLESTDLIGCGRHLRRRLLARYDENHRRQLKTWFPYLDNLCWCS